MVVVAQQHQVRKSGWTAPRPVSDMVSVAIRWGSVAPGPDAASVTEMQGSS